MGFLHALGVKLKCNSILRMLKKKAVFKAQSQAIHHRNFSMIERQESDINISNQHQ
jgi:hypothetical protein